jgi:hypothetical protein
MIIEREWSETDVRDNIRRSQEFLNRTQAPRPGPRGAQNNPEEKR